MYLIVRNVEEAFNLMVQSAYSELQILDNGKVPSNLLVKCESRNGPVYRWRKPVVINYTHPQERVLINEARDCNPFFHIFEAIWMLAGRNDVAPVTKYVSRMKEYSDDGLTFHGAYGYRWRKWFGYDQISEIILELRKDTTSRRCVLQMWSGQDDLKKAKSGGKDVPCNLSITFNIVEDALDMCVFNRSNDALWGALGANYVHMSFLQEYIARKVGVLVGQYSQVSSNMHFYTHNWDPQRWLNSVNARTCSYGGLYSVDPLDTCWLGWRPELGHFDREANDFVDSYNSRCWKDELLERVAKPMLMAYDAHKRGKRGNYKLVEDALEMCIARDWRIAARNWINRRRRDA